MGSLCDWKDSCRISGGSCCISSFGVSVCMYGAAVKGSKYHLVCGESLLFVVGAAVIMRNW